MRRRSQRLKSIARGFGGLEELSEKALGQPLDAFGEASERLRS